MKNYSIYKINKMTGLVFFIVFVAVGILFLFLPEATIIFFNSLSVYFKIHQLTVTGLNFYLVLAGAFMYLVSILSFFMFRHPHKNIFPLLLAHGKLASSLISLYMFIVHGLYLIYISNFFIDGIIGIIVLLIYLKMERVK